MIHVVRGREAMKALVQGELEANRLHPPQRLNDDFATSAKAELRYRALGWSTAWLTDDGKLDPNLGRILVVKINGACLIEMPRRDADEFLGSPELVSAPRFVDTHDVVTFLFKNSCGTVPRKQIGAYVATAFGPCPDGWGSKYASWAMFPPSNGLQWLLEPSRRERLPVLPVEVHNLFKGDPCLRLTSSIAQSSRFS